jgi:hypothetical protein
VITDLDDLVDNCEPKLEPERAFETRRKIATRDPTRSPIAASSQPQRQALTQLAELDADMAGG